MTKEKGTTPNNGELIFGKYPNMDEAKKGFEEAQRELSKRGQQNQQLQSMVTAQQETANQYKELLERMTTQAVAPSAERQAVDVYDKDGDITGDTVKAYIASQIAPIQQTVTELPNVMRQTMQEFAKPYQIQTEGRNKFFGSDPSDSQREKFLAEMPSYLLRNQGINKSFEMLSANPETASDAYDVVYKLWKADNPAATTAVDESAKAASGRIPSTPGPPATLPGETVDKQQLTQMGIAAGESYLPGAKKEFFSEWMKGTKLEKHLESMKQDLLDKGQLPGE